MEQSITVWQNQQIKVRRFWWKELCICLWQVEEWTLDWGWWGHWSYKTDLWWGTYKWSLGIWSLKNEEFTLPWGCQWGKGDVNVTIVRLLKGVLIQVTVIVLTTLLLLWNITSTAGGKESNISVREVSVIVSISTACGRYRCLACTFAKHKRNDALACTWGGLLLIWPWQSVWYLKWKYM